MKGYDIIRTPGFYTDQQRPVDPGTGQPHDLKRLAEDGWEWISYQVVNPHETEPTKNRDLTPAKDAGLSPGVWGVSYGSDDLPDEHIFYRDGKWLGEQAIVLAAEHLGADIEMAAKGTRDAQKMHPFIVGVRDSGWSKEIHLCTLGSPYNPNTNDYSMDIKSFSDTGGGIISQDYLTESASYSPENANTYWNRVAPGVPINHMIGTYGGKFGRIGAAQQMNSLIAGKVKRNLSVFLLETTNRDDLDALKEFVRKAVVPVAINSVDTRAAIVAEADKWLKQTITPQYKSRLNVIRRLAASGNTDALWVAARDEVVAALDKAGIPS